MLYWLNTRHGIVVFERAMKPCKRLCNPLTDNEVLVSLFEFLRMCCYGIQVLFADVVAICQ